MSALRARSKHVKHSEDKEKAKKSKKGETAKENNTNKKKKKGKKADQEKEAKKKDKDLWRHGPSRGAGAGDGEPPGLDLRRHGPSRGAGAGDSESPGLPSGTKTNTSVTCCAQMCLGLAAPHTQPFDSGRKQQRCSNT